MAIISNFKKSREDRKKMNGQKTSGDDAEMSFLDHLEELRWHLMRSITAIVIMAVVIGYNIEWFFDQVILAPFSYDFPTHQFLCGLRDAVCEGRIMEDFVSLGPYEQFLKSILVSIIAGGIIAFPYLVWEMWRFIKPGLHPHERKGLRGNVVIMSLLFFIGVSFAYYVILPFAVRFLAAYSISENIANTWRFGEVISMVVQVVLAGGILFEMPIVVYYLTKMGIVTPEGMKQYRRIAIVILLVLSAVLTPPDIVSQVLIFCPLLLLYELSIGISRMVIRKAQESEDKASKSLQKVD